MARSRTRVKRKKYQHAEPTKKLNWSKGKSLGLLIILSALAIIITAVIVGLIWIR